MLVCSMNRLRLPVASARTTAGPTSAIGRRERSIVRTTAALSPPWIAAIDADGPLGGMTTSASSAVIVRTSALVVMWTGPGRSAVATRCALRSAVPTDRGWMRVAHFVIGVKSWLWSMTWWVKSPSWADAICPEMASIGARSR
jgi:hypothetical protein